jgi:hypothetical protein
MRANNEEHLKREVEHARWRVRFFQKLLRSHLALDSNRHDADWGEKADLYRRRHAVAVEALQKVESL